MRPLTFLRRPGALAPVLALAALTACGDDDGTTPSPDAGAEVGPRVRFELGADPMPFGAVPWPDDLYLGADGRIDVGELPSEESSPDYFEALRTGLAELDGFGVVTPIYFELDAAIDPGTLPPSASASTSEEASAFVVDVDPASPTAYVPVPVDAFWSESDRRVALRPADGHPLAPGRRYAAVLTTRVRDEAGRPIAPSPRFAAVRDATTRPADALEAEAWERYAPVLSSLSGNGLPREQVAALAVFRVQSVGPGMDGARAAIYAAPPPVAALVEAIAAGPALDARLGTPSMDVPGLDVDGGVQHGSIGFMIHGTFEAPSFLSEQDDVHGVLELGADGRAVVKGTDVVPFTLFLPRGDLSALRLVVYQHGLGADRSAALAIADALAGAGYGVIAIDAPWHGLRTPRPSADTINRFTGAEGADGFGDQSGGSVVADFAGIEDGLGPLGAFHPVYLRDALRQSASDLMAVVRLVREGDWTAVRAADAGLATLAFSAEKLAFTGVSLGGVIGTIFVGSEPEIGAAVLVVTGGSIVKLVSWSAPFHRGYFPLLLPILGVDEGAIDWDRYPAEVYPQLAIWQMLLDRGDPVAHAHRVRASRAHVLMLMARHDETLHNFATESLARAIGVTMVGGAPMWTDVETGAVPLRGNVATDGSMLTRGLFVHEVGTHQMISHRTDVVELAHPIRPPFEDVPPVEIANPVDAAQAQVLHFLESWRSGGVPELTAPVM